MHKRQQTLSSMTRNQLNAYIKQQIKIGNLKLPNERELCQIFSVSRITLRKVLSELEAEGCIARYQGKGTFINPAAYDLKINLAYPQDLSEMIQKNEFEYSSNLISYQLRKPDDKECKSLQLSSDEDIIEINKLFCADGYPVIFCKDILPTSILTSEIPSEELNESIFNLIQNYSSKQIVWDTIEFDANCISTMNKEIASAFEDENIALLSFEVINYSLDNKPILYSRDYINPKRVNFHLIRHHRRR